MRRKAGSAPGRAVRVTEQLHQELAEIIRAEVKDPRLGMVTVTSVDLTGQGAWEVEVRDAKGVEHEVLVDPADGKVVSSAVDADDDSDDEDDD